MDLFCRFISGADRRRADRSDARPLLFCLQRGFAPNVLLRDLAQPELRGSFLGARDPENLGCSVLAVHSAVGRRNMVKQTGHPPRPWPSKTVLSGRHRFLLSASFHLLAFGFE